MQLDGELVSRLDEVASAEGVSRSELLRRGAIAVLDARDSVANDERLREAYRRLPPNSLVVEAASRLAARTSPNW